MAHSISLLTRNKTTVQQTKLDDGIIYEQKRNLFRQYVSGRQAVIIILLFLSLIPLCAYTQPGTSFRPVAFSAAFSDTSFSGKDDEYYDEVPVILTVPRIGTFEIQALVYGQLIYLPVKDLFDFLKIRSAMSAQLDSVSGFIIYPKNSYVVDKTNNRIIYMDKVFELQPRDIITTENNLYLKSDYFGKIFGLDCFFDFRSLSVTLNTKIELPAIREMQLELMRQNIGKLKGEKKADTTIKRSFPLFHLGMADWSVVASQETKRKSNTRASLAIGGILAGGELDLSMNYNSDYALKEREQYYQWRFVNNDNAALRQVVAGKIFAQSTSSIYSSIIGVQLTNTPTTYRRSFGSYTLSDNTEPEWTVELYVNNVLVDYKKADASGFYTFQVPMVYGNSLVKLKFYGPWGEERTSERFISIPFNFIPRHQFEYNVTAGVVDDEKRSRYSRTSLNYGLSRRLTIGGGMEYLSSVTSGKFMPFVNASMSIGQHILLSGEHTYKVRTKGIASYRTASNMQVEFDYTLYNKYQTAVQFNFLEEKKLIVSMPFRAKKFTSFSRFTLDQYTLPENPYIIPKLKKKYTSGELLLSTVVAGVSSNLTTYALFTNNEKPYVFTNLSFTLRLPAGIRVTPQAQYEYRAKNFSMVKTEVEKSIFNRGYLNLSYQKTFVKNVFNQSAFTIGFRYNFSFAQTFFSASKTDNTIATIQSARGSLLYDGKTKYTGFSDQTSVGRGGIIVSPFLDINCNGRRDKGEPKVAGLMLRINGGRLEQNLRDTTIRISFLEAYTNYYIELDKNSFDNISWQIQKPTISVAVDANSFKLIEVPVAVVAEVSGKVLINGKYGMDGLSRIIVNIYNSHSVNVAHFLTESDGFFDYIGLPPGEYTASIDAVQLEKLKMTSSPALSFKILPNKDGDIINNLEFTLRPFGN